METQAPQVRRLYRRTRDKLVFGVAGGIADYFGIDAVWIRLGFVLTTLLGGMGILAYVVLWVIMPTQNGSDPTAAERALERVANQMRTTPTWIGAALLIVGVALLANVGLQWRAGVVWGLALIVVGVLLFIPRENKITSAAPAGSTAAPPVPPPPPGPAATAPTLPLAAAAPPPPRVRERSALGWVTVGVLFLALGIVSLLEAQDVVSLSAAQHLALVLAVLGAGLLVGTWYGRARWIVPIGIILLPFVLAASLVNVPITGGVGDREYRPITVAAIGSTYRLAAGQLRLDFTDVPFTTETVAVKATNAAGRILVLVPDGMALEIRAKTGAGQVSLFGQTYDGLNVEIRRSYDADPGVTGLLRLDLETALGEVEVRS